MTVNVALLRNELSVRLQILHLPCRLVMACRSILYPSCHSPYRSQSRLITPPMIILPPKALLWLLLEDGVASHLPYQFSLLDAQSSAISPSASTRVTPNLPRFAPADGQGSMPSPTTRAPGSGNDRCNLMSHPTSRWLAVKPHPNLHASPPHLSGSCNALAISHLSRCTAPPSLPSAGHPYRIDGPARWRCHRAESAARVCLTASSSACFAFSWVIQGPAPKQREIHQPCSVELCCGD